MTSTLDVNGSGTTLVDFVRTDGFEATFIVCNDEPLTSDKALDLLCHSGQPFGEYTINSPNGDIRVHFDNDYYQLWVRYERARLFGFGDRK